MPQRCQSQRLGVDRVRFAAVPACPAGAGHQPGRHPHDVLTGGQQGHPQAAGSDTGTPSGRTGHSRTGSTTAATPMAIDVGADRLLPEAPTHLIQGDDGVGALVGIGADHDHAEVSQRTCGQRLSRQAAPGTPQSSRPQPYKPRTRPTSPRPSRTSGASHQLQAAEQRQQENERTPPRMPTRSSRSHLLGAAHGSPAPARPADADPRWRSGLVPASEWGCFTQPRSVSRLMPKLFPDPAASACHRQW